MNPKKTNNFYKIVAEEMNLSDVLVEDLIEFYYKDLRNTMSNLKHPRIMVNGLGQFVAKTFLVRKFIDKYTKSLNNHDTSTYKAYHNKKQIEQKLSLLISLEELISKEEIKKTNFKSKKNETKS
jgi:hypothetical protein